MQPPPDHMNPSRVCTLCYLYCLLEQNLAWFHNIIPKTAHERGLLHLPSPLLPHLALFIWIRQSVSTADGYFLFCCFPYGLGALTNMHLPLKKTAEESWSEHMLKLELWQTLIQPLASLEISQEHLMHILLEDSRSGNERKPPLIGMHSFRDVSVPPNRPGTPDLHTLQLKSSYFCKHTWCLLYMTAFLLGI